MKIFCCCCCRSSGSPRPNRAATVETEIGADGGVSYKNGVDECSFYKAKCSQVNVHLLIESKHAISILQLSTALLRVA